MNDERRGNGRNQAAIDDFVERVSLFCRSYAFACSLNHERVGRRLLIAGLRVATLELVGAVTIRRPCRTFDWTLKLAWSTYQRARVQYLVVTDAPPPAALAPVAR